MQSFTATRSAAFLHTSAIPLSVPKPLDALNAHLIKSTSHPLGFSLRRTGFVYHSFVLSLRLNKGLNALQVQRAACWSPVRPVTSSGAAML